MVLERDLCQILVPDFRESRQGEVPRIPLLRTPVNKGMEKGQGCYAPALVRHVAPIVRRGHPPPHAKPHFGGALPPLLLTTAIPSLLLACDGGLANADPTAIIRGGRLGSKCRWIESFNDKPHAYE